MSGVNRITAERNQRALLELVTRPGNDICADCKARNPRWASYNLGIFICMSCASVHRKLGTHISKVKSLTMDEWTKEQVESMRQNGNLKSNALYNPNEIRHPPPVTMSDVERDSELEQYIRSKYEYKRFIDKAAFVASRLGPSRSGSSIAAQAQSARAVSVPTTNSHASAAPQPQHHPAGIYRPSTASLPNSASSSALAPTRSVSQPFISSTEPLTQQFKKPVPAGTRPIIPGTLPVQVQAQAQALAPAQAHARPPQGTGSGVWDDLISLQTPSMSASLPLQVQAQSAPANLSMVNTGTGYVPPYAPVPAGFGGAGAGGVDMGAQSTNPFYSLQQQQQEQAQATPSFRTWANLDFQPKLGYYGSMLPQPPADFSAMGMHPSLAQQQPPQGMFAPSPALHTSAPTDTGAFHPQSHPQLGGFMSSSPQPQGQFSGGVYGMPPPPQSQQAMFAAGQGPTNASANQYTAWMQSAAPHAQGGYQQQQQQQQQQQWGRI